MCIIIDTNTLPSVFDNKTLNHAEFKPVYDWINNGRGKVVYGGTKYVSEIGKYLGLFIELRKENRAVYINDIKVDNEEVSVSHQIQHVDFDDQHLVSLLRVSGCKLMCSLDRRAYRFFKHPDFFYPASKRPKIYRGFGNRNLLNDNNIADVCKN